MDFNIPFRGLTEGKHDYEFSINDKFFEKFPESEIKQGRLKAKVELMKRSTGLEVYFEIDGKVKVVCDRCLDEYLEPIEYSGTLFFEYGSETIEISDELVMLSAAEDVLDISNYLYEFILLSLPVQRIHPDDENGNSLCNPDMLERLKQLQGKNNDEIDDPRWDKLKDLI